ncbi:nitroreductase family protein [Pseudomonas sp. NPDC087697]|uniref:nitroreductase family protein n=1 Tax=Pseudomonas sp. NPDC087697 TaxID=3364447 RepID=UPI00381D2420
MIDTVKIYARTLLAGFGFLYDLSRYVRYSGWRSSLSSVEARNYYMVKVYHTLEKSLSFTNRKPGSGWAGANALIKALEQSFMLNGTGYHDLVAITVLKKFAEAEKAHQPEKTAELIKRLVKVESLSKQTIPFYYNSGAINRAKTEFNKGRLITPEDFFLSRYSLREFSDAAISAEELNRALEMAMKSPSACNRQSWHVYHLDGELAQHALAFQDGNRGFGHKIKDLLIVTTDLRAFVSPRERYQHWIDGGMFSMSLILALHSIGIASCCLNWSQSGRADINFRKVIKISPQHTVMMMLAIGYPNEQNTVCASPRRPLEEVYTKLSSQ